MKQSVCGSALLKNISIKLVFIMKLMIYLTLLLTLYPRYYGGKDKTQNLVCSCQKCSQEKEHYIENM